MGFSILKCFSRREASFHLNNIGYAAALIKAVSRKACVSPPKFHYAKNSDVPPKRTILSAKASRIVQGHISVA